MLGPVPASIDGACVPVCFIGKGEIAREGGQCDTSISGGMQDYSFTGSESSLREMKTSASPMQLSESMARASTSSKTPTPEMALHPASSSVAAALRDDPFYGSITADFAGDDVARHEALKRYFAYSIEEGTRIGRTVELPDSKLGIAVWMLPQRPDIQQREARNKLEFLRGTLGQHGVANYQRMVEFMKAHVENMIAPNAWYLSIVALAPEAQGRGLGRELLRPTLEEADAANVDCYLETFTPRALRFYEGLGFVCRAEIAEPTARANYIIMSRPFRERAEAITPLPVRGLQRRGCQSDPA